MNFKKIFTLGLFALPITLLAVYDSDLQLKKYDATDYIGMPSHIVEFGGSHTPLCKLGISDNGQYFFLKKVNSNCIKLTNSSGVKIICNSDKSVCKTRTELVDFVQGSSNTRGYYVSDNKISNKKTAKSKDASSLKKLTKNLSYDEIFSIEAKGSSTSNEFHNYTEEKAAFMKNISEISGNFKTMHKEIQVRSKIPLTGSYKVKVKFNITQRIGMKSNLFQGWLGALASGITEVKKEVKYETYYLNSQNSYKDLRTVDFKIVGASMNALGVNMTTNIKSYKVTSISIIDVQEIN